MNPKKSRYLFKKIIATMTMTIVSSLLAFSSVHAQEADWPNKDIRLIVPYELGSSSDQIARVVAAEAAKKLKQTIVVENQAGSDGNNGTAAIAKAKADGYTFGISANAPLVYNQFLYKKLNFDPNKDLYPLTLAATQANVIAVSTESGIDSFEDLAEKIKANPDKMRFAISANGSNSHLIQTLFLKNIDGDAVGVPYDSSAEALNSLIADDTQFTALSPIALVPLANEGRLKLLAQTGAERIELLSDIPTLRETGVADIVGTTWSGFVISNKVPQTIKDKLQQALIDALNEERVAETLRAQYMEPMPSSPQEFKAFMQSEINQWRPLINDLDIEM